MTNTISYLDPTSGGVAKQLVVFVHGYGSNKEDLMSLADFFKKSMPDALFISANGPYECDLIPNGYSWFSLEGVNSLGDCCQFPESSKQQLHKSVDKINALVDKVLEEYNIPETNVYFIGFSQGATVSVYAALHRKSPVKGVLAYSGFCLCRCDNVNSKPGFICLAHGKKDEVIPFKWHAHNKNTLRNMHLKVKEFVSETAYHEIPVEALEFGRDLIEESL